MVVNDGINVLGSATPRPATSTGPADDFPSAELVELVASLSIVEVREQIDAGELTVDEVRAAEDRANGGRGRTGIEYLLTSR